MAEKRMISTKDMIQEIVKKHSDHAEKEVVKITSSKLLDDLPKDNFLTPEKLKELVNGDFERLKKDRTFYEDKMLELHELILALTDEGLKLANETRLSCLEYLLEELNVIFSDILAFVQGEGK